MPGQSARARIGFRNDYSNGAHPRLWQALADVGDECNAGYGLDRHSARAADLIRDAIAKPQADVHLLMGGTQTNLVALTAFLRPHQAAIAAESGHIATHETGAIEAGGHKVLSVSVPNGKLTPTLIAPLLATHGSEHMVQPRLVYISQSTELGTLYSKAELAALSEFCRQHGLLLYLDGARLGSALTAVGNDLQLADIAMLTDAFYIGGTKNGALFGEALVVVNDGLKPDLRYIIKQRGAMLAKGMALGVQFCELFADGLLQQLGNHANQMAQRLRDGLAAAGAEFLLDSPTNQQFVLMLPAHVEALAQGYDFERWQTHSDGRVVVRLLTSWSTRAESVDALLADYRALLASPVLHSCAAGARG